MTIQATHGDGLNRSVGCRSSVLTFVKRRGGAGGLDNCGAPEDSGNAVTAWRGWCILRALRCGLWCAREHGLWVHRQLVPVGRNAAGVPKNVYIPHATTHLVHEKSKQQHPDKSLVLHCPQTRVTVKCCPVSGSISVSGLTCDRDQDRHR